jgi:soluble lytic murein transglycosylase-like protein
MTAPSVTGATAGTEAAGAATAATERVQRLQRLIGEVEGGPASFAAALDSAMSGSAGQTAATATGADPSSLASFAPEQAGSAPIGEGAAGAYGPMINEAAAQNGLDPAILAGLIKQESGFDPGASSSAGAQGLTQLMPGTASSMGVTEPLDPAQSIQGGARYLGQLTKQFGGNTTDALAAYNAGPGAVQQYGGVPPYAETQQYVTKVLENANAYRNSVATATSPAMEVTTT